MENRSAVLTQPVAEDKAFSSDMSADMQMIAYSTDSGELKMISGCNSEVLSGNSVYKKDVKFYPEGHDLITSVDKHTGLQLWDAASKKNVYTYDIKGLGVHSFSCKGALLATSEYNIKFFDLKTRYCVNSISLLDAKIVDWSDENTFFAANYVGIHEFDVRNLRDRKTVEIDGVKSLKTADNAVFFVRTLAKTCHLAKLKDKLVSKVCVGEALTRVNSDPFCLAVSGKDCMEFFTQSRSWKVEFSGVGTIRAAHYNASESRFFVCASSGIHSFYYAPRGY